MELSINEVKIRVTAAEDTPLLWVLRDHLGMTGTKFGCGMALCGACTVHLDGQPIRSCVMPVSATALLTDHPTPTDADIDAAMAGNICRCGTYPRIRVAIKEAAGRLGAKT
jgi:isoquinoline 1-oxidoreductase subunit alpha